MENLRRCGYKKGSDMDAAEILQKLDRWDDGIPEELLLASVQKKDEITPGLIAAVEDMAANPKKFLDEPERNLYYWAVYLLAHFEEERALPALLKFVRLSGGEFDDLVSDIVQEDGAMLLANVALENLDSIAELLHDQAVGEDARIAAAHAIGMRCGWGVVGPAFVVKEFRRALEEIKEPESYLAAEIINAAMDLNLRDLGPTIVTAYDRGIVDDVVAELEFVSEWLADPEYEGPPPYLVYVQGIDDIVDFFEEKQREQEMAEKVDLWREGGPFRKLPDEMDDEFEQDAIEVGGVDERGHEFHSGSTYVAPVKPGRNDPCSCGSGKKFKKCCGK
jgi:hypothetical protein